MDPFSVSSGELVFGFTSSQAGPRSTFSSTHSGHILIVAIEEELIDFLVRLIDGNLYYTSCQFEQVICTCVHH